MTANGKTTNGTGRSVGERASPFYPTGALLTGFCGLPFLLVHAVCSGCLYRVAKCILARDVRGQSHVYVWAPVHDASRVVALVGWYPLCGVFPN